MNVINSLKGEWVNEWLFKIIINEQMNSWYEKENTLIQEINEEIKKWIRSRIMNGFLKIWIHKKMSQWIGGINEWKFE